MVKKKNYTALKARLSLFGLLFCVVFIALGLTVMPNIKINADLYYFYIPESTAPSVIADTLKKRGFIRSRLSFAAMAAIKNNQEIGPGMYELENDWSNLELLSHFETHEPKQTIFITLPEAQSRKSLVGALCSGLVVHPDDVFKLLNDEMFIAGFGALTKESVYCIFLPRNYRIYKDVSAERLLKRLYQEYQLFWNAKRLKKARQMHLTPSEVQILASIVYAETKLPEEMPRVAGVYVNRLQRSMRLESDPTLVFAAGKIKAKRVFFKDKQVESPYNTYKYKGLPPGPICTPPSWVIDKVLEFEGHDYLYFCASPELSGKHLFAETFDEHLKNAQKYRKKMDERNVF